MSEFKTQPVEIGTLNEWTLFYLPHNNSFMARKGKKERFCNYRDGLLKECNDADAEDLRKKRRIEPCEFTRWDPEKQVEQKVRLTSFSARGVALKPLSGEDTIYLERDKWRSKHGTYVLVVKPDGDLKRLYAAVEGLRRAQAELLGAENAVLAAIKVEDPGYGSETAKFHEAEDALRSAINKVTKP